MDCRGDHFELPGDPSCYPIWGVVRWKDVELKLGLGLGGGYAIGDMDGSTGISPVVCLSIGYMGHK